MPSHTLGPFRLDTQHNLLLREGTPVPLGRRAIALLRTLVERPGALVSKDALIEAAWSGRLVEESNLPAQIAALRRVSGRERSPARSKRFCTSRALIGRRLRSNRFFRCGALISLGDTHRGPERHRERRRDAKRCGLRHQKHLRVPIARRAITKDLVLSSRPRSVRLTMAFCRLLHDPPSLAGEERQPVPRLAAGL